jgi:hypothetical protein
VLPILLNVEMVSEHQLSNVIMAIKLVVLIAKYRLVGIVLVI